MKWTSIIIRVPNLCILGLEVYIKVLSVCQDPPDHAALTRLDLGTLPFVDSTKVSDAADLFEPNQSETETTSI